MIFSKHLNFFQLLSGYIAQFEDERCPDYKVIYSYMNMSTINMISVYHIITKNYYKNYQKNGKYKLIKDNLIIIKLY